MTMAARSVGFASGSPSVESTGGVSFGAVVKPDTQMWLTGVVDNVSLDRGDLVTAKFRVYNHAGKVISQARESSRIWADHPLVIPALMKAPEGVTPACATLEITVEPQPSVRAQLPPVTDLVIESQILSTIDDREYARLRLTNRSTRDVLKSRVDVVCTNADGRIVGGGEQLLPTIAAGRNRDVSVTLIIDGTVESCDVWSTALQINGD